VYWEEFIQQRLNEDVREGDFTSLSCIKPEAKGSAQLLVKDHGVLAGVELAALIFNHLDPQFKSTFILQMGAIVQKAGCF
jgi:nicotinate-nucleotide pyrophosphorylase (carboxylating)